MLVWQRPNLLLLDEPTNHLDLTTREALSMALNEFEGTVMLVSHDRALLREVCDEFWLVTRGGLEPFDGDLDDYQRWLLEQSKAAARAARPEAANPMPVAEPRLARKAAPAAKAAAPANVAETKRRDDRKSAAAARQQRADAAKPLKKELNQIDNRLGVLFAERDRLEAPIAADTIDASERAESGRRLKAIGAQIEQLEARWLELSTQLDDIAESIG
jgi:ATP-binding cassette subfamily F protein 3